MIDKMMVQVPHPEWTSFDIALEILCDLLIKEPVGVLEGDYKLVHGILRSPDGTLRALGWVERESTDQVIFTGIVKGMRVLLEADRPAYYSEAGFVESTSYSFKAALIKHLRTNSHGPWVEKYIALCSSDRKVFS